MAFTTDWNQSVPKNNIKGPRFSSGSGFGMLDPVTTENVASCMGIREARYQNQLDAAEHELALLKDGEGPAYTESEVGEGVDSEGQLQSHSDMAFSYAMEVAQERENAEKALASLWAAWVNIAYNQSTIYIQDDLIDKNYSELADAKANISAIVNHARITFETCNHKPSCIPSWLGNEQICQAGHLTKTWRPSQGAMDAKASLTALILFAEHAVSLAEEFTSEKQSKVLKSDLSAKTMSKNLTSDTQCSAGQKAAANAIEVRRGTAKMLLDLDAAEKAVANYARVHFLVKHL
jgi:hypothetical protein